MISRFTTLSTTVNLLSSDNKALLELNYSLTLSKQPGFEKQSDEKAKIRDETKELQETMEKIEAERKLIEGTVSRSEERLRELKTATEINENSSRRLEELKNAAIVRKRARA